MASLKSSGITNITDVWQFCKKMSTLIFFLYSIISYDGCLLKEAQVTFTNFYDYSVLSRMVFPIAV